MKKTDIALLSIFTAFVLIVGSLIFILPQKDFSESENRYLSKMPKPTVNSLLKGDYAKELSSFYKDQFPLRKIATATYAISERAMGKKTVGGVICDGEQLIAISTKENDKDKNLTVPAVFVDSKYTLFTQNSPNLDLYYNTDHHRTTYGAYLLYLEACKKLKIKPYPESYFKKQAVCTDFYGTAFFKSRLPKFICKPDTIELWRYDGDKSILLTAPDTTKTSCGFYDFSKLDTADKYAIFLGGNYSVLSVTSSPSKPTLLLYKDSFANAVVPFLALHFNIDLVDPRYATRSQIDSISSKEYGARLFIGCLDSFG